MSILSEITHYIATELNAHREAVRIFEARYGATSEDSGSLLSIEKKVDISQFSVRDILMKTWREIAANTTRFNERIMEESKRIIGHHGVGLIGELEGTDIFAGMKAAGIINLLRDMETHCQIRQGGFPKISYDATGYWVFMTPEKLEGGIDGVIEEVSGTPPAKNMVQDGSARTLMGLLRPLASHPIASLRFGLNGNAENLDESGKRSGVTRERARQICESVGYKLMREESALMRDSIHGPLLRATIAIVDRMEKSGEVALAIDDICGLAPGFESNPEGLANLYIATKLLAVVSNERRKFVVYPGIEKRVASMYIKHRSHIERLDRSEANRLDRERSFKQMAVTISMDAINFVHEVARRSNGQKNVNGVYLEMIQGLMSQLNDASIEFPKVRWRDYENWKMVNIRASADTIKQVNAMAKKSGVNRSSFVCACIVNRMRGDELALSMGERNHRLLSGPKH